MLRTLSIENIAVIEKARIEFNRGLNVLTGETGAGKSIVVDSINAILGERTSRELVRHGADHAFVSASFEDISAEAAKGIAELGFDADEDGVLLLSRRISENGKSVCRINGFPATASILKEVGRLLVNIHGQHDSQQLLNPDEHYTYIDRLGGENAPLSEYRDLFHELISVRRRLRSLTSDEENKEKNLDLLDYQIKEIEQANVHVGEHAELTKKKLMIDNSEAAVSAIDSAISVIKGGYEAEGASASLSSVLKELSAVKGATDKFKSAASKIADALELLEEANDILLSERSDFEFDEGERERVGERLDALYKLGLKYGGSEENIVDYLNKARAERNAILSSDEELERLTEEYSALLEKTAKKAEELSDFRKRTAKRFEAAVKEQLEFLDMPKIRFSVKFEHGNLSANGVDKIEFLISTNPGEPPKPLAKIASGGELSRIMLAIKNVLAKTDAVGTLIFDEVDTGVSGRASGKIGQKLKAVSKDTQVITVTHSAQIAAFADEHFLITKDFENEKTYTKVTSLDFDGRKRELARIMGGLNITDSLLKSAEEMLLSQED